MYPLIEEHSKFEVDLSIEEAVSQLNKKLEIKGWRRVLNSNSHDNIRFKIKTSFKSWGEILSIKISKVNSDKSNIEVTSKPILFTTLLDYGKNRKNVNKVKEVFNINY